MINCESSLCINTACPTIPMIVFITRCTVDDYCFVRGTLSANATQHYTVDRFVRKRTVRSHSFMLIFESSLPSSESNTVAFIAIVIRRWRHLLHDVGSDSTLMSHSCWRHSTSNVSWQTTLRFTTTISKILIRSVDHVALTPLILFTLGSCTSDLDWW